MLKFLPEQAEVELVTSFQGDPTTLGNVEKYFRLLSKVPHYALRIEASIIRESFEEEMSELEPSVRDVKTSCEGTTTKQMLFSAALQSFSSQAKLKLRIRISLSFLDEWT